MDAAAIIPGLEPAARERLAVARAVELKRGQKVFEPGQACAAFLVVTAGTVRVSTVTSTGRELLLYRVAEGETCVLTTACLLAGADYDAEGVTESDVEAIAIPKVLFEELMAMSPAFRSFVFSSYGVRLRDLIGLVQDVSQRQLDRRLARFLVDRAAAPVTMTQQEIAAELGTAREVVSRLLKQFAADGLVQIERKSIVVAAPERLARLAGGV